MSVRGLLLFSLLAAVWAAEDIRGKHHRRHKLHNDHHQAEGRSDEGQHAKYDHAKRQYGQQPQWFGAGPGAYPTGYYDYIVIGSGAGGGVVAPRLARYGYSVLLIEAGDDQGQQISVRVPALQLQSTELITQRWDYYVKHYADPTQQARDSKMSYRCPDRIYTGLYPYQGCVPLGVLYPRAGTLGGCTQHHAMIMVYPWESDFDYIAQITGNASWSAQTMRQYFVRLERNQYIPSSVVGHGYSGWLHITVTALTLVAEDLKLTSLVVAAATALGKNLVEGLLTTVTGLAHIFATDFNAPGKSRDTDENLWQVPIAVDPADSSRSGTRRFIVETAQQYPNLHVQMNTFVTKILLDTHGYRPRAYGVQYEVGQSLYSADPRWTGARGQPGYAFAIREVILSAGSFETPKMLMLAGIGPAEELARLGIQTVVNSPGVGRNMQDRYEYGVVGKSPTPFSVSKDCTFGYRLPDPCLQQWLNNPTPILKGVYGSNGLALAVTLRSSVAAQAEPDVYISGAPAYFQGYYPNYASEAVRDANHWTWIILKAQSRNNAGTVTLRSTNPFDMPEILFNSLAIGGNEDVQAVMDAVDFGRRAFGNLIPLGGDGFTENDPGEAQFPSQSAQLAQNIRDRTWGHHACGTARIGAPGDPYAVLDAEFRVNGVDGLRVVDASIWPKIPGFFISLPIHIIAEKAADVIIGKAPDPYFATPDAGGLLGSLGFGLVGGLVSGLTGQGDSLGNNANPEGLLGTPANLLGGLGLFDNTQPTGDNPPSKRKRAMEYLKRWMPKSSL